MILAACSGSELASAVNDGAVVPGEVVVVDAGAEPRQQLRYDISDQTLNRVIETTTSLESRFGGEGTQIDPTTSAAAVEVTTRRDGDEFFVTLGALTADSGGGQDLDGSFDTRGLALTGSLNDRSTDPIVELLGAGVLRIRPLPEDEVGVGAIWHVDLVHDEVDADFVTRTTLTLREFTDGGAILDVAVEQFVETGALIPIGDEQWSVAEWDATATGFVDVRFDQYLPVDWQITATANQVLEFGDVIAELGNTSISSPDEG